MSDIKANQIGVVGDHAHIEGGIHFHGEITPAGKPLHRPPPITHFTNRETELAALLAELQPGRVVTLWGPGGIGKSALAAEAIWRLAPDQELPERFPDGIIFHSFYNQPQADLALEAIVRACGEEPKPTYRDAAQRVLAGRRALLLLDGTEAADDLETVLAIRGECGVLVTSRRRQDREEERQAVTPLETEAAVKLLRAWAKGQAADTDAARQICGLVGNLPLAVRLVGRYLDESGDTAAEYLTWLGETPLEALDQGQRQAHCVPLLLERSLAQVSETAVELLGVVGLLALAPLERAVLAVALEREAAALRRPLAELVTYGLLLRQGDWYEVSHALIHTYARERLEPEPGTVTRLAAYYTQFAKEQKAQGLAGYARLDVERPHIMRLLANCLDRGAMAAARGLAWAILVYLVTQGHLTERIIICQTGLQIARKLADRIDEEMWLGNLGLAYRALGQVEEAIDYHQQALVVNRETGVRQIEAIHLNNLGMAYRALGQVEEAIDYYERTLAINREIDFRYGEATDLNNLGMAYRDLGQVAQAKTAWQQALTIFEQIQSPNAETVRGLLADLDDE